MNKLVGTILPPVKHKNVPENAKWLSGQGEGTWFCITKEEGLANGEYRVRRVSPQGNLDCDRVFVLEDDASIFDIAKEWNITHVSHCAEVRIIQDREVFVMNFKKEFN